MIPLRTVLELLQMGVTVREEGSDVDKTTDTDKGPSAQLKGHRPSERFVRFYMHMRYINRYMLTVAYV